MKYIITGDSEDVLQLAKPAREEGRFMSDTQNLEGFKWYPLDDNTHVLELWTEHGKVVDPNELAILTREYSSLTIGIVDGVLVKQVIAEGEVEELID